MVYCRYCNWLRMIEIENKYKEALRYEFREEGGYRMIFGNVYGIISICYICISQVIIIILGDLVIEFVVFKFLFIYFLRKWF